MNQGEGLIEQRDTEGPKDHSSVTVRSGARLKESEGVGAVCRELVMTREVFPEFQMSALQWPLWTMVRCGERSRSYRETELKVASQQQAEAGQSGAGWVLMGMARQGGVRCRKPRVCLNE